MSAAKSFLGWQTSYLTDSSVCTTTTRPRSGQPSPVVFRKVDPAVFLAMVNDVVTDIPFRWKYVDDITVGEAVINRIHARPTAMQLTMDSINNRAAKDHMTLRQSCQVWDQAGQLRQNSAACSPHSCRRPGDRHRHLHDPNLKPQMGHSHWNLISCANSKRYFLTGLRRIGASAANLLKFYVTVTWPSTEYAAPVCMAPKNRRRNSGGKGGRSLPHFPGRGEAEGGLHLPPTFGLAHISRSRQDPSSFTHTIPQCWLLSNLWEGVLRSSQASGPGGAGGPSPLPQCFSMQCMCLGVGWPLMLEAPSGQFFSVQRYNILHNQCVSVYKRKPRGGRLDSPTAIGPTAHWSYCPLVLQPIGPVYGPLILRPLGQVSGLHGCRSQFRSAPWAGSQQNNKIETSSFWHRECIKEA